MDSREIKAGQNVEARHQIEAPILSSYKNAGFLHLRTASDGSRFFRDMTLSFFSFGLLLATTV
jgi:hypothetical protein